MKLKSLSELTTPDPLALRLAPLGFGALSPEDAAVFQQQAIARADLHDDVPEGTRQSFERLRALHSYGIFFYGAYTLAHDLAWLVLEQALRERFVASYKGRVPLVHTKDRTERALVVGDYQDVYHELRHSGPWFLKLEAGGEMPFRAGFGDLLDWARRERLLAGQRNRLLHEVYVNFRNQAAHPAYHVLMPEHSALAIRDLAEVINKLWGHPTPGGRLYPAPLPREPVAIVWSESRGGHDLRAMRAEVLGGFAEPGEWSCIVVLACHDDPYLFDFDARCETTAYPAVLLWGPGSPAEAREWLQQACPTGDTVEYLDRLFAIRTREAKVSLPLRPEVLAALPESEQPGDWRLLRADFPIDAFGHARHLAACRPCGSGQGPAGGRGDGAGGRPARRSDVPPALCPVEEVATGTWDAVVRKAEAPAAVVAKEEAPGQRRAPAVQVPARFRLPEDIEHPWPA